MPCKPRREALGLCVHLQARLGPLGRVCLPGPVQHPRSTMMAAFLWGPGTLITEPHTDWEGQEWSWREAHPRPSSCGSRSQEDTLNGRLWHVWLG